MSVPPLKLIPISQFRAHTKFCLHRVAHHGEQLKLTYRGKGRVVVIPMSDALPLWHLQGRALHEVEQRMAETYARWKDAKSFLDAFEASTIDEKTWRAWSGFDRM